MITDSEYNHKGTSSRMSTPWGREGASSNADKTGQGQGGGLVVSGHPFQCELYKKEEGI